MSKLHLDLAAEKEAVDIGKKFMNSTDVVGDMSRTYGTDLSSVRIHTDDDAARRTAERGVDAFSTGKEVFFARNAFNQNDPASRGLLAHELSHSLQQGIGGEMGGGMTQSAPMGAEQGGLIDWFRNLRRRKAEKKRLDADDAKFARWDREAQEHVADFEKNGLPEGAPQPEDGSFDINITELTARAQELGWTNHDGNGFNEGLTENFFREISGVGVAKKEVDGQTHGKVLQGYRRQQDMMDLFNNHDEATTLRVLKPLMDLNVDAFVQQYPLHKMTPQERRIAFPQIDAMLQPMVGLKQWGEKYGSTTLSEANRKKLNDQIVNLEYLSKWAYNVRLPADSSFEQMLEMNVMNAADSAKGFLHKEEMQERLSKVKDEMGAGGCMLNIEEFKRLMGRHMPRWGGDKEKIGALEQKLPGLKYNQNTQMVSCPLPLEDLRALTSGDKSVKKRYADELRSMSWVKEDGTERRAGQYDATTDEFMEGFEDDARYFGRMSSIASALEMFGGNYMNSRLDARDLKTRAQMANNTYQMMAHRGEKLETPQEQNFIAQYFGVKNRTWIKRLLLNNKKNKKWY